MDARVIFRKETLNAMNKPLGRQEKGVLLYNKLKELDEKGYLSQAKSRVDVARMCGYTNYKSGWAWVANMVRKGSLKEILVGKTPDGKNEYEYHIGSRKPLVVNPEQYIEKNKHAKVQGTITVEPQPTKIVIKYKELSVELDQADSAFALQLIAELIDKIK